VGVLAPVTATLECADGPENEWCWPNGVQSRARSGKAGVRKRRNGVLCVGVGSGGCGRVSEVDLQIRTHPKLICSMLASSGGTCPCGDRAIDHA
jgi:hypothetical protein